MLLIRYVDHKVLITMTILTSFDYFSTLFRSCSYLLSTFLNLTYFLSDIFIVISLSSEVCLTSDYVGEIFKFVLESIFRFVEFRFLNQDIQKQKKI